MGKQLGQGDIDALFAAAGANSSATSAGPASEALERYDFSRAGQISNEQMRAISSVNDLFARNLMHTLGAWLRTWGSATLSVGVMQDRQMRGDSVVAEGPYRCLRNPLYVGAHTVGPYTMGSVAPSGAPESQPLNRYALEPYTYGGAAVLGNFAPNDAASNCDTGSDGVESALQPVAASGWWRRRRRRTRRCTRKAPCD